MLNFAILTDIHAVDAASEHVYNSQLRMRQSVARILAIIITCIFAHGFLHAQIYDGITQSDRYRVWAALSQPVEGGEASFSTYFGYRYDAAKWINFTGLARYNFTSKSFLPAIWVNFNIKDRFYLLSRSILDCRESLYKQGLAATVKLPLNIMIDATWDNVYNGRRWCDGDRLQVVAGMNITAIRTICNVGYSMRARKGVVANVRYRFDNHWWVQSKYDSGTRAIDFSCAFNFN